MPVDGNRAPRPCPWGGSRCWRSTAARDAMIGSGSHVCGPPWVALAATWENGVPEATSAAAAWASRLAGVHRGRQHAVSNSARCRLEVALQLAPRGSRRRRGPPAARAGGGDELHLLVDERRRHGAQHLVPGERLAGQAAAVPDVLPHRLLQDLGHHLGDLRAQVGAGGGSAGPASRSRAAASATPRTIWWPISVSRYVATKALVAVGWSPDPSWPLPAPLTGGSCCSPLDERYAWEFR